MVKKILAVAMIFSLPLWSAWGEERSAKNLTDIVLQKDEASVQIRVVADGTIENYKSFTLDSPNRLVLDVFEVGSRYSKREILVNHSLLEKIRIGLSQDKVRLVLDIPRKTIPPYKIIKEREGLLVVLGNPAKAAEKKPEPVKAPAPPPAKVVKRKPEPVKKPPPPAKEVKKLPEKKAPLPAPERKVVETKREPVTIPPPAKEVKKLPEKKAPLPAPERRVVEKKREPVTIPAPPPPAKKIKKVPEQKAPAPPAKSKVKVIPKKEAAPPRPVTEEITKTAIEQKLTGREIAQRAYDRDDGRDSFVKAEMILIDKREKRRLREMIAQEKDYGELTKALIRFTEPDDIAGTGFLSWENDDGTDDQFLFLPELRRVRRVVSSQKDKSFVNTDFTYEDLERRKVDDDTHRLLREEIVDGKSCYVVESVPKGKKSQYGKVVSWVIKDSFFPVKVEYYKKAAQPAKVLTNKKIEKVDGIWTAMEAEMADLEEKHRTITRIKEVHYNRGIPDDVFTKRSLEKY